jgi:hypothetical protein
MSVYDLINPEFINTKTPIFGEEYRLIKIENLSVIVFPDVVWEIDRQSVGYTVSYTKKSFDEYKDFREKYSPRFECYYGMKYQEDLWKNILKRIPKAHGVITSWDSGTYLANGSSNTDRYGVWFNDIEMYLSPDGWVKDRNIWNEDAQSWGKFHLSRIEHNMYFKKSETQFKRPPSKIPNLDFNLWETPDLVDYQYYGRLIPKNLVYYRH